MDYTTIITTIVTAFFGGGLGVIFERKKRETDNKIAEAEFNEKIQSAYSKFVDDYQKRLNEVLAENEKLVQENKQLLKELNSLREKLESFVNRNNV